MNLPDAPLPQEGFFVTHFLTEENQAKSRDFYAGIQGRKVVAPENPCIIKLINSWIILNSGGGPTPDKPEVFLEPPQNLNLRVADAQTCYKEWQSKGAHFLTEPLDNHGWETDMLHARPGRIHHRSRTAQPKNDQFTQGKLDTS